MALTLALSQSMDYVTDPSQIAAVKDFAPAVGTIIAAVLVFAGGLYSGRWQRRNEVQKLAVELQKLEFEREKVQSELDRGTGRDPGARKGLYDLYFISLDRFYEPEERTASGYREWSKNYSEISTKIRLLGVQSVCDAVDAVDSVLHEIRKRHLTDVHETSFDQAWYDAVSSNQGALDKARERVLDEMRADIGPGAQLASA
jgi:hypothetical protein